MFAGGGGYGQCYGRYIFTTLGTSVILYSLNNACGRLALTELLWCTAATSLTKANILLAQLRLVSDLALSCKKSLKNRDGSYSEN